MPERPPAPAQARSLRIPGRMLGLAVLEGGRRQLRREWAGSPIHRALMAHPRPEGLRSPLKDLRPGGAVAGQRILDGHWQLGGGQLDCGPGGDPWDRPSPSRRFAAMLHRFDWMRDLLALGEPGEAEGLRLVMDWRRVFGTWNSFSWAPDLLERRVFNLALAAGHIDVRASEAESAQVSLDLIRQARHLLAVIDGPVRACERACAAALAGTALAGPAADKLTAKALGKLARTLPVTVEPDGGHASRNPRAALELLLDLKTLDEALVQRGLSAPEEVLRAIDRLAGAVRFFTLQDGALPDFNGGEAGRPSYVAAARASEPSAGRTPAARNGYHRLDGKTLQVIADGAPAPRGAWSVSACAHPLAMEVLAGPRRLIVGCGWSPEAQGPQALRLIDAASTGSIGDLPCGEPLRGFKAAALGPRLHDAPRNVEARRHETAEALWLELAHDGWVRRFGLRHERRLYLDRHADEMRGEDRFTPMGGAVRDGRKFIPSMVRFHLHPDVKASLARDGKSVLLRLDGADHGWWLRSDSQEVALETSVYFQDSAPKRSQQVVLRGQVRLDKGARLRWKLAPAEPH